MTGIGIKKEGKTTPPLPPHEPGQSSLNKAITRIDLAVPTAAVVTEVKLSAVTVFSLLRRNCNRLARRLHDVGSSDIRMCQYRVR